MAIPARRSNVDPQLVLETADYLTDRLNSRLQGLDDKLSARIHAIEDAQDLAHEDAARVPTLLDRASHDLKDLIRTVERSTREVFKIQNDANAAAIDKTEKAVTTQIHASDGKIDEAIKRIAALEVRMGNGDGVQKGASATIVWIGFAISALYGVLATIGLIVAFVHH